MEQVTFKKRDRVPIPRAQSERETLALRWLLDFIQAAPDELPGLLEAPGYSAFILSGRMSGQRGGTIQKPPVLLELVRFHAKFAEAMLTVLSSGTKAYQMKLRSRPVMWYLFPGAGGLHSYFHGNWELSFLDCVNSLLVQIGKNLRVCRGCARIFAAEHGLQKYCSPRCGARHRQAAHTEKRIAEIRELQGQKITTVPEIARKLGISKPQAKKYLSLARRTMARRNAGEGSIF
jgi:hypothetical protein